MQTPAGASFVAFAGRLADAARLVTAEAASAARLAENKGSYGNYDPVTAADRQAEVAMRALIEAHYPGHGIEGEEFPPKPNEGRYVWSLDPIDGTRAFICGLPSWTTLIALLEDGQPIIGLIDAPAVGERYVGTNDTARLITSKGARPLSVSGCTSLTDARVTTTDPYLFGGVHAAAFERVRCEARLARYGYDAYGYARLAAGGIDLVIERDLRPHDVCALVPVIRGAGGIVGNWRGGEDLAAGDIVAAATQELFDQTTAILAKG